MKICILQTIHRPLDKRVFYKEAISLAAAGHDVLSICPSDEPVEEVVEGVRLERFPMPKSFLQRFVAGLNLIPKGLKQKSEVYLCIDPEAYVAGAIIKWLTGKKIVLDVHEFYPADFSVRFPGFLQGFVYWAVRAISRFTAKRADHVILTKDCLDPELYEGLKTPRTTVLNTAHLQDITTDFPQDLVDRYASRPTIIHEGDFGVLRGSQELLDAMKILVKEVPDIMCVIIGRYTTGDEDEYRQAIKDAGLEDNIDMPGMVPFQLVPAYIGVSKLGLILFQPRVGISHRLIMPHKMFDYMREAKAFVTTDYPVEIKKVVDEEDCAYVVDVSDPQAIADGVLHLLRNPDEAERLGKNGRKAVEMKYNWEKDEQKLLGVFESLQ